MRCDQCHEREAVVHLTQIAEEQVVTVHLCERCAAEKGVESSASLGKTPVGTFLASMGKGMDLASAMPGLTPSGACPTCHATLSDFRESGRLGCAECYRTFEGSLRDLLRRLHGSSRHVGKRYAPPGETLLTSLPSLSSCASSSGWRSRRRTSSWPRNCVTGCGWSRGRLIDLSLLPTAAWRGWTPAGR